MKSRFYTYGNLIIDNIEGGYYSPERHYNAAMGVSGETMFGMDRKWGGAAVNTSKEGKEFWQIVDANSANWAYNSKGGKVEGKLRKLAAEIMYNNCYAKYFGQYLTPQAQKAVEKSPRLEAHLFYGCWNGVVRFKDFANTLNEAVKAGKKGKDLETVAINSRLNYNVALIRRGGEIMRDKIFPKLSESRSNAIWWITGGVVILAGSGFWGWKKGWFGRKK